MNPDKVALEQLEAEHQSAVNGLTAAHARLTAAATALDQFWSRVNLGDVASGEVLEWL